MALVSPRERRLLDRGVHPRAKMKPPYSHGEVPCGQGPREGHTVEVKPARMGERSLVRTSQDGAWKSPACRQPLDHSSSTQPAFGYILSTALSLMSSQQSQMFM